MSNTSENLIIDSVLTLSDRVGDIVNHKAFNGFGELLLPYDNNAAYRSTSLRDVATLMPYHGHVRPDVVISSVNHMINEVAGGKTIFYNIYSVQQMQQNPSLQNTGLFFFRGKPGAPFAIVSPGWRF